LAERKLIMLHRASEINDLRVPMGISQYRIAKDIGVPAMRIIKIV